jgi:hypothetical protein
MIHTLTEIDPALYFLCLISFIIFPLLQCFLISYLLHEYGMRGEQSWSVEWAKQAAWKKKKKKKKYVGWMNGLGKGGGQRGARHGGLCANRALGSDDEKWS